MAFGYGYNTSAYNAAPYNGTVDLIRAVLNVNQVNHELVADAYVYVGVGNNQTQNDHVLFSDGQVDVIVEAILTQDNQSIESDVIRIVTLDLDLFQDGNTCHICAYTGIAKANSNISGIAKHNLLSGISSHSNNASVTKINRSC